MTAELFSAETGRYLERLAILLGERGAIDPDELLRLARGVRGSAHMAGATTVEDVARRLEGVAYAVRDGELAWSDDMRGLALQTVRDLEVLVRALSRWGPDEERRVRQALERWDDLRPPRDAGPAEVVGSLVPPSPRSGCEALLRDALALRPVLEELLARGGRDDAALQRVIDELFELIGGGLRTLRSESRG